MDLSALVVFAALIILAMGMVQQSQFVRYLPLEGRNMTTGILSAAQRRNFHHCASFCVKLINCESFIYNPESKECQLYNTVFPSAGTSKYQPTLRYHYMPKGINDWCPLNDGYQLLALDGPCVKFHFDLMTWHEANISCSAYSPNSRLVVLDTKEKNDLVKSAGRAMNSMFRECVAIGLYEQADNVYTWVDGSDVNFTDLSIDESRLGVEDCVWFYRQNPWTWGRYRCTMRRHRICEIAVDLKLYREMMDGLN